MFARTTQFEIDTLRIGIPDAVQHFEERILPAMRNQPGYAGAYAMLTPEGRGLLLTLWETEEAAEAGVEIRGVRFIEYRMGEDGFDALQRAVRGEVNAYWGKKPNVTVFVHAV